MFSIGRTERGNSEQRRNIASRAGTRPGPDSGAFQWCRRSVSIASPTDRVRANVNLVACPSIDPLLLIRYREQVEKVTRLREETVRAIVKNSTEIAMFKEEISQQLRSLREFAEAGPQ